MSNVLQQAATLRREGKHAQAADLLGRHLQLRPADPAIHRLLAVCLCDLGKLEPALFHAKRAAELAPKDADTLVTYGNTLVFANSLPAAMQAYRAALAIQPQHINAALGLGGALVQTGAFDEAERVLAALLTFAPDHAPGRRAYARALEGAGKIDEAIAQHRATMARVPDDARTLSSLCFGLQSSDTASADDIAAAHRRFGEIVGPRGASLRLSLGLTAPKPDNAARPLRVGYVSPDFREHSVASFIEPVIREHDRTLFTPVCFHTGSASDAVTARFAALCEFHRAPANAASPQIPSQAEASLARRIADAKIDVLVDLTGHTGGGTLGTFAIAPAPLQLTYLGYPDTTGLTSINARIVDAITDPSDPSVDARCTETLARLPRCFLTYQPRADAPPVAALPALTTGAITFGSFNNLKKLSPTCLALWARVLAATPGSRLLIKGRFASDSTRARFMHALAAQGVSETRVEMLPYAETARDHLAQYARVDIALDSFPYHGTTTTCEAFWQGVPVVTRTGDRHAARVGASLLHSVGLDDLAAPDDDAFVRRAVELASDLNRLASLRSGMRDRLKASPLLNAAGFTRAFEAAIREQWQRKCQ